MRKTYEVFKSDGMEVQQHWFKYTIKIDEMVEEALKQNVKRSLQDLARAINGDGKSMASPLFRIIVSLENNEINLEPRYEVCVQDIIKLAEDMPSALEKLERLPPLLTRNRQPVVPYSMAIESEPDITKLYTAISHGLEANAPNLQAYISTWYDKYHEIWETNKDRFIARYAELDPPLAKFDADVARYGEVANNVQNEETLMAIHFVMFDSALLKNSLVQHCNVWQSKFTSLLYDRARKHLQDLSSYMADTGAKLAHEPATLEEMCDSLELLEESQRNCEATAARFPFLHEHFQILAKYDVDTSAEIQEQLDSLPAAWTGFQQQLKDTDAMLGQSKKKFKQGLLKETEELTARVAQLRSDFLQNGPFSSSVSATEALASIDEYKRKIAAVHDKEKSLKGGLKVFQVDHAPYKEVMDTEKDIGHLEALWAVAAEWDRLYDGWKTCPFADIDTEQMEQQAQAQLKKLVRLAREVKDKDWEMVVHYRKIIEQFKRVMPLVQDLKNPALRDRHWKQLVAEVGKDFDPQGADFTLGKMIDLGLDEFAENVSTISGAASKELSIEQTLASIKKTWGETSLEVVAYKDRGHFILRGTDDIYQLLEDNQVTLSTMKASRFVKAFETEVDFWERTLSLILEVVEMILTVQRQWMYLENIFLGEDIRKQLPAESSRFDDINEKWRGIMTALSKENNAHKGTHTDGLLATLTEMNGVLEQIQKSLDMYLETKRQMFPRFYFVSNDDLLEVLGQSKNPEAVQPHLLKCFDNIKALELTTPPGRRHMAAIGMHSADGEYVPFQAAVTLDGPVEGWLSDVEREMRHTLYVQLHDCRSAQKKQKRDKWIKDWAGQLVLTVSQMSWTADCVKAMNNKEKGGRKGLKSMKKKQVSLLNKLTEAVRAVKNKVQRKKLVALITIEVHSRDVIDRLIKVPNIDQNAFEWLMQLRFYWEKDQGKNGDCVVRQTNTKFTYGYEYLGNSGRLVITPLTDRCYMTLTTALHLHRGGSPKGPAGTGKTETVKDLGKALGDYVIVVNCTFGGGGVN